MGTRIAMAAFLAAILAVPAAAPAAGAPTGFRTIPWGASVGEVRRVFPEADCVLVEEIDMCVVVTRLAGVPVSVSLLVLRSPEPALAGLQGFHVTFPPERFPELAEVFIAHYGQPHTDWRQKYGIDRYGWEWGETTAMLLRAGAEGFGYVSTPARKAEQRRRAAAALKLPGEGL